jgi:transposase
MKKTRKQYTREQKLEIIKLSYEEGQSLANIALRFNISTNTIYNWRNQFKKHQEDAFPGNGIKIMSKSEREIENLKKQLREAQLERDILKKAIGIFSKKDKKFTNL